VENRHRREDETGSDEVDAKFRGCIIQGSVVSRVAFSIISRHQPLESRERGRALLEFSRLQPIRHSSGPDFFC